MRTVVEYDACVFLLSLTRQWDFWNIMTRTRIKMLTLTFDSKLLNTSGGKNLDLTTLIVPDWRRNSRSTGKC